MYTATPQRSASTVVTDYLATLHAAMTAIPTEVFDAAVRVLRHARSHDATVLFVGNGGSASTASHFAADLAKNTQHPKYGRFRTICLSDNVALFSAWANDEGYENVFLQGAKTHLRPNDVLVAISGSGNSENVLRAAKYARDIGCEVIGLGGFAGGKLRDLCTVSIVIPAATIEVAEDGHLIINHAFCTAIRALDSVDVDPVTG